MEYLFAKVRSETLALWLYVEFNGCAISLHLGEKMKTVLFDLKAHPR